MQRNDFSVNSTPIVCISVPQLQSLMADAVDILAGRTGERVWTKIQKVTACSKGQESRLFLGQETSLTLVCSKGRKERMCRVKPDPVP